MSNIYFCSRCSVERGSWVRMEYVKWVFPWRETGDHSAGDLYHCPLCQASIVEYTRLDPQPNREPKDVLEEGKEMPLLQGLLNL